MTDPTDDADILDTAKDTAPEAGEEQTDDATQDEDVQKESDEDLKAELAKAQEVARNQKIRAEKAEAKLKEKSDAATAAPKSEGLTSKDTIALINAKVHEDDIDEVIDYARFKKISIAEALKSTVVKASLAERQEHRTTAQATSTGKNRSGAARASGDALLEKAKKTGELPDSDEGLAALVEARRKK